MLLVDISKTPPPRTVTNLLKGRTHGRGYADRWRRVPHRLRLLPHVVRRSDRLPRSARALASAHLLRQHRRACELDAESIRGTGNSTCLGGIANRSSYWVPTLIDTQDNAPIVPDGSPFTTRTGALPAATVQPLPAGLRMIAGDPNAKGPHPEVFSARWKCIGGPNNQNDLYQASIANCDVGAQFYQEVFFPQCWDGINLDSPDHKSHMSYTVQVKNLDSSGSHAECPKTHPVVLPRVSLQRELHGARKGCAVALAPLLRHVRPLPAGRLLVARRLVQRLEERCQRFLREELHRGAEGLPRSPAGRRPEDLLAQPRIPPLRHRYCIIRFSRPTIPVGGSNMKDAIKAVLRGLCIDAPDLCPTRLSHGGPAGDRPGKSSTLHLAAPPSQRAGGVLISQRRPRLGLQQENGDCHGHLLGDERKIF